MHKYANAVILAASILIILGDSVPSAVLRTAIVSPLYSAGVITLEQTQELVWNGHF